MFVKNKYYFWYFSLIEKSKNRNLKDEITVKHHILPRSLGGTDDENNICVLTEREHYIVHKFLIKITKGKCRNKMANALWYMSNTSYSCFVNSRTYNYIRDSFIESRIGTKHSEKSIRKNVRSNCKFIYEVTFPDGTIRLVDSLRLFSEEHKLDFRSVRRVVNVDDKRHLNSYKGFKFRKIYKIEKCL